MRKEFHSLKDAIRSLGRIIDKTSDIDLNLIKTDYDLQDIVEHNLRVLTECIKAIPQEWRDMHPEIPWTKISGMRNLLVHRYYEVNYDVVIEICRDHAVPLQLALKDIAREVSGPFLAQDDLPE